MAGMDNPQRRAAGAYKKVQGLLKEVAPATATPPANALPTAGNDSHPGFDKVNEVARFLSLIGRDEAATILKRLPDEEVQRILDHMARLEPISRREAVRVLTRFGAAERAGRVELLPGETRPGPETAREILVRAFGVEVGEKRFYEILPDERPYRFAFLEEADGRQLSFLLKNESTATVATMCVNMPRPAAARLLGALEEDHKGAVVRRMAQMDKVAPEALEAIEKTLRKRLEAIQRPEGEEVDGQARLADILRYMDLGSSDRILQGLGQVSEELAERIREQLNSPEDILYIPDRDLQKVLQRLDDVDLATLIKGKKEEVIQRIQTCVSQRRWEMILMHRESLGPMRRGDVDGVTTDFMKLIREMAMSGEIVVRLPGEDEWVE